MVLILRTVTSILFGMWGLVLTNRQHFHSISLFNHGNGPYTTLEKFIYFHENGVFMCAGILFGAIIGWLVNKLSTSFSVLLCMGFFLISWFLVIATFTYFDLDGFVYTISLICTIIATEVIGRLAEIPYNRIK